MTAASLPRLYLAAFLIVFGSHCWLIARFGSCLPFWDQWDAEAFGLYMPWFDGSLGWSHLVEAHNEHRIVLTRLIDLALLGLNGEWDARLQTVVSAALYGWFAVLWIRWTAPWLGERLRLPYAASVAVLCALPVGYENILGGFQIQVFLLLLLSLHAIHSLAVSQPFSRASWLGIVTATLALGTMASGFFAAAAVLPVLALRARYDKQSRPAVLGLASLMVLIVVAGVCFRVTVPHHDALAAHGPGDFFRTLISCAAWPLCSAQWPALILLAPWACFVVRMSRERRPPRPMESCLLGAGVWALLQMIAISVGRGGSAPIPPRYAHVLGVWTLVNLTSLFWLWPILLEHPRRKLVWSVAAVWIVVLAASLAQDAQWQVEVGMSRWRDASRDYEQNVRAYVDRGEESALDGKIPYPDSARLKQALDAPAIRAILPTGRAPLSRAAELASEMGPWILGLGIVLLATAPILRRPSKSGNRHERFGQR